MADNNQTFATVSFQKLEISILISDCLKAFMCFTRDHLVAPFSEAIPALCYS